MRPVRGDVVRSTDPFKLGSDVQRPWLVVSTDRHPFSDEQCIAVAISTKRYDHSVPLSSDSWITGGVPERSYASPWAVHSPRLEDLDVWQGRVTDAFVDRVIDRMIRFIGGERAAAADT